MKRIFTFAIVLSLSVAAFGQNKINPAGRYVIDRFNSSRIASRGTADSVPVVGAIVRMTDGNTVESLTAEGYEVTADLGDMALVRVPVTSVEKIAAMPKVRSVSLGGRKRMLMKSARAATGVDEVHSGISNAGETKQAFTGSGVILGLMDGGLDPNHLNFAGRVERLWHITGEESSVREYTSSTVGSFTTDDRQETHATHVAGIMGGGYKGTSTYMNGATRSTGAMPHYGVAPDASLAMSCGDLYEANILQGVQNIIDYAREQGRPAAINLSLGNNSGPHDGTDDFSAALDRLGEDALICVAAGNEGDKKISISKTFTESDKSVKTILYYNKLIIDSNYGALDIWASDSEPLKVTIGTVSSSGMITNVTTVQTSTGNSGQVITKGTNTRYGSIYAYSGVDVNNGRYNVYLYFDESLPSTGRFAITVTGKAGQHADIYFDGYSELTDRYNPTSSALKGFTAGSPDCSISGMACGDNVLAVGAYATLTSWTGLGGSADRSTETNGASVSYSSYGHDFSGRQLPQVAAPGSMLMSSFSRYYIDGGYGADYGESASTMTASAKNGTATHYWGPMEGTSMACPFMTGVLALWLQADPSLTMADVLRIIEATSTRDSHTTASPERFGYGKVNAAEGLRYILANASTGSIAADPAQSVILTPTATGYDITVAGSSHLSASLYDMQGRCVADASSRTNTLSVSTQSLASGIYLLKVNGTDLDYSAKIVCRH